MKKTIATYYANMCNGGIQRVISMLIPEWIKGGNKVILFTDEFASKDDYPIDTKEEILRIVLPSDTKDGYVKRNEILSRSIKEHNIDVMIFHLWMNENVTNDRELFNSFHIPFVLYTHAVFSYVYLENSKFTNKYIEELIKADAVITLTDISKSFYEILGCDTYLVDNPILLPKKTISCNKKSSTTILWIGRFCNQKKPCEAIEIFKELKYKIPDVNMIMVGKGEEENKVKKLIKKYKLENDIKLVGYDKDVEKYYAQSRFLLMTSYYEGYSMIIVEAMAYGIPIAMYDLSYLPTVQFNKGLVSCNQGDRTAIVNECIKFLSDEAYYEKMCRLASDSINKKIQELNLKNTWNDIFDTITIKNKDITNEGKVIEVLINHIQYGYEEEICKIKKSKSYKIGNMIINIPKKIINIFK